MKLIALGKESGHVCQRYRIEPVRAALRAAGHWFGLQAMPKTPWGRFALYRELRHANIVIVQRRLLSTWELPLLRRMSHHLIFDFDDALFQNNSNTHRPASPRRLARFKAMMQACDQVFAGNDHLAECASRFTTAAKIVVMPTCVDTTRYSLAQHHRSGSGVRLAWIGSSSTLSTLQQQADVWRALGKALPGLELHMICDRFPNWPGINIIPIPWSESSEASALAACDIGMAWMPDDSWSLGKCGLKVLQYQAAGLPVVANPVGVHRRMITPHQTGLWANTLHEWIDAISLLMHDPALRQKLGQESRKQVETQFSTTQLIQRWKRALRLEASSATTVTRDAA